MAATKRAVDFTNVKDASQFNTPRVPEGDYRAKILSVDDHASQGSKTPNNWVFTVQLVSKSRGAYPYYVGWDDKQAWKIRNLCIAAGMAVPKKKVNVDPNKLVGKEIGVAMEDDEYNDREKSVIASVFPTSDLSADHPGGTTTKTSKAKSSKAAAPADDEDEDDVADGDDEELELDEL